MKLRSKAVPFIFNAPIQANQATISHDSSIWIHHLNVLHGEEMLFLNFFMFETFVSWCTTLSIFPRNSNRPTKRQFPMVLRFESIIWTYCLESRCFYFFSVDVGTFCCLFFRLNIFPETQTGQPSNNFPWFFDLFTSFRRTAPREYVFILLHSTEGVYFLLDVSFVLGDTSSYQNFQFEISLLWKCYLVQSL